MRDNNHRNTDARQNLNDSFDDKENFIENFDLDFNDKLYNFDTESISENCERKEKEQ